MLIGAGVGAAAWGTGFAIDVGVNVILEVAQDGRWQTGQSAGINPLAVGGAAGLQNEVIA